MPPHNVTLAHLIAGAPHGDATEERLNPARPDEVVAVAPKATGETVSAAIAAAEEAFPGWRETSPQSKAGVLLGAAAWLEDRLDEVAGDLTREEGKTYREAKAETARTVQILRFFAGEAWRVYGQVAPSSFPRTTLSTTREPLGVVGIITPWNFPLAVAAWKIGPALAAGNAIVFKPSSITPLSGHNLVQAFAQAGLPPGVLNLVFGGAEAGDALVRDPRVSAISFTGSTKVGMGIHRLASERLARTQLEMGGKNALVVLDDADPDFAARIAALGGFGVTGQACTATSRLIVTPKVRQPLVEALARIASTRYMPGDPMVEATGMGPLATLEQLEKVKLGTDAALREGGRLVVGGRSDGGQYFEPTVIEDVKPSDTVAQEEIFGPVIGVIPVSDFDEAMQVVNGTSYGLTAGIVTTRLEESARFVREAAAGVVKVNRPTTGLDFNAPFGGIRDSSTGTYREQGTDAIDFFTWVKTAYVGHGEWA